MILRWKNDEKEVKKERFKELKIWKYGYKIYEDKSIYDVWKIEIRFWIGEKNENDKIVKKMEKLKKKSKRNEKNKKEWNERNRNNELGN